MSDTKLVYAPISIQFSLESINPKLFRREFDLLEQSEDDPVGHWVKMAKAKGETRETDQLLLELIVELHRKVDELNQEILGRTKKSLSLEHDEEIDSIHYEHFKLKNEILDSDKIYYGRVLMPTFPRRDIPIYFQAVKSDFAPPPLIKTTISKKSEYSKIRLNASIIESSALLPCIYASNNL